MCNKKGQQKENVIFFHDKGDKVFTKIHDTCLSAIQEDKVLLLIPFITTIPKRENADFGQTICKCILKKVGIIPFYYQFFKVFAFSFSDISFREQNNFARLILFKIMNYEK